MRPVGTGAVWQRIDLNQMSGTFGKLLTLIPTRGLS